MKSCFPFKIMIYKCIQQIMKKNLLLLKDLLESWRTKFTNIWPLYQQMCKLDDITNEYNNTYHRTIKMKPVDVKPSIYIEFGIKNDEKDTNFEVGDQVRISKHRNSFETAKDKSNRF